MKMIVGLFPQVSQAGSRASAGRQARDQPPHFGRVSPLPSHPQKGVRLNGGPCGRVVCKGGCTVFTGNPTRNPCSGFPQAPQTLSEGWEGEF